VQKLVIALENLLDDAREVQMDLKLSDRERIVLLEATISAMREHVARAASQLRFLRHDAKTYRSPD
jgi:hypothetical protein